MPADSLTIAVTTGLGFSVLAGIVSGVCYILTYGLPQTRRRRSLTPWQCGICGRHFRSIDGVLEVEKVARCAKCGVRACKEKCAEREPAAGWLCKNCKTDSWMGTLLNMLQPGTSEGAKKMEQTRIDEIDEDLLALQKREREQVRDFIERLVGALLGGDLDDVSVKKVYNDVKYDAIYRRYHDDISEALTDLGSSLHISIANLPISGQSPCSTHATLKLLIQKFIQEAAELPKLHKFEDHPAIPDDTKDRTYEDLLSTAIINKVIQNSQEGTPSRSVSSRASSRRRSGEKEYFFGERNLDSRRIHDDTSSLSSLDSDTMSLKIRGCIKEVSSSGDETKDEDEVDSVPGQTAATVDWLDNWRLQKRKYDGTTSPVPVPMLVPDPITEAKVLIGDRDAEDTTDLSDAASDYEEALEPATLNAVLVNSRTVIGGRSPLESLVSKQESISDDGSTDVTDLAQEKEDIVKMFNGEAVDAKEEAIVEAVVRNVEEEDEFPQHKDAENESLISLDSNTEKDLEYTEKYASLPRTIYKSTRLPLRQSLIDDTFDGLSNGHEHKTDNVDSGVTSDEDEKQKIFKGTYSEREKEKWNHAVPLSNNPYSKSNLERRLSSRSSNSSIGSSFDRDYYIRDAAKSAGARRSTPLVASTPVDGEQPIEDDEVNKAKEVEEKAFVFKAVPAIIQPDSPQPHQDLPALPTSPKPDGANKLHEDEQESSIEPSTPTRPNQLDISSDSDLSIERTYNIETGQVIRKPNSFRNFVMEASRSPEGIKYQPKEFDAVDENQNTLQHKKRHFLMSLTREHDDEDNSSLLDSSFEAVTPPRVNHFKLVEEIANETSDQYDNTPISPPAQYKPDSSRTTPNDELFSLDANTPPRDYFKPITSTPVKSPDNSMIDGLKPLIDLDPVNDNIKSSNVNDTPKLIKESQTTTSEKRNDSALDPVIESIEVGTPNFFKGKQTVSKESDVSLSTNNNDEEQTVSNSISLGNGLKNDDVELKSVNAREAVLRIEEELMMRNKEKKAVSKSTAVSNGLKNVESKSVSNGLKNVESKSVCNGLKKSENVESKSVGNGLKISDDVDSQSEALQRYEEELILRKNQLNDTATSQPNTLSLTDDEIDFINKNMDAFREKIVTVFNNNDDHENEEFSLTYSEVSEPEAEITDLKEKKLVNNLLGEFSKSFPNLNKIPAGPNPPSVTSYRSASVDISEVEDDDDLPSVRRLSKIFDASKNGKQEQVYSLTARSIPKEFRQELKKEPTTPTCDVIKEVVSSEASPEETLLPFPKAKSKIEFFEKLKK